MRRINILVLLFFIVIHYACHSQSLLKAGMSLNEAKSLVPELFAGGINQSGKYQIQDTINGLAGEWGYTFENDTLNWIHFSFYINDGDQLNEENFNKCLKTTEQLIEKYITEYGNPDEMIEGDKYFKDPYKEIHWGYDVTEARWITDFEKVKVEFSFFGGKGQYFFQIIINHFRAGYPYFD